MTTCHDRLSLRDSLAHVLRNSIGRRSKRVVVRSRCPPSFHQRSTKHEAPLHPRSAEEGDSSTPHPRHNAASHTCPDATNHKEPPPGLNHITRTNVRPHPRRGHATARDANSGVIIPIPIPIPLQICGPVPVKITGRAQHLTSSSPRSMLKPLPQTLQPSPREQF